MAVGVSEEVAKLSGFRSEIHLFELGKVLPPVSSAYASLQMVFHCELVSLAHSVAQRH